MGFCVNRNNITVTRFDYGVSLVWNAKDSEGNPVDITGCEVQVIIKRNTYCPDSSAILNETIFAEGTSVEISITKELTSNPVGTYYYALRLMENGTFVDTLIQAQFIISQNTFSEGANV